MAEDLQKIVEQFNPAKWHAMLSRRSRLEKFVYWYRRPRGTAIRVLEILSFRAPLLSRLFTDNSVVNMGITFERIFHFLAHDTKIGPLLVFSKRPCFLLSQVNVELRNSFIRLHSGHLLSPFKSDRQFMSGMYIDELHRLAVSKDQKLHKGCYFVLPKQDFYFHFLIEFLPRVIESKIAFPEIEVVTPSDQPSFVHEALALVNVPVQETTELILNLEFVFVAEETQRLSQKVSHKSLKDLQVPIETMFPIEASKSWNELRLLLTRKGQPRYNEKLERELFTPLIEIGFLVVDPRELSLAQQILLFRKATVLVGFHGGAMSNMVFMPERSQVFEIYAEGYDGFNPEFFLELASCGNHRYRTYSKTKFVTLESIIEEIRASV